MILHESSLRWQLAAYPHLYSFTSTKSVVHWFQIIRNKCFQMYDDDVQAPLGIGASDRYYKVARFPTRNIKTPIVLVYGGSDSLIDIKVMLKELPRHTEASEIPHYEHLDFLWGSEVATLVFPRVFDALETYTQRRAALMAALYSQSVSRLNILPNTDASNYSDDDHSSTDPTSASFDGSGDLRDVSGSWYARPSRSPLNRNLRKRSGSLSDLRSGDSSNKRVASSGPIVGNNETIVGASDDGSPTSSKTKSKLSNARNP